MIEVRDFLNSNFHQLKLGFLVGSGIVAFFLLVLFLTGDNDYDTINKFTLPIWVGAFFGIVVILVIFAGGMYAWMLNKFFLRKYLSALTEKYGFFVSPFMPSKWRLAMPVLQGQFAHYVVVIQLVQSRDIWGEKDMFIAIEGNYGRNNKQKAYREFIYPFNELKRTGIEPLINEIRYSMQPRLR